MLSWNVLAVRILAYCLLQQSQTICFQSYFMAWGSSFCFLNLGTSGRHGWLLPHGNRSQPSTRTANLIAARTACLVWISICLGQVPVVEQPDHKRGLIALQRWQELLQRFTMYKGRCVQGAYAAETKKPTGLYSTHTRFSNLKKTLSCQDKAWIVFNRKWKSPIQYILEDWHDEEFYFLSRALDASLCFFPM